MKEYIWIETLVFQVFQVFQVLQVLQVLQVFRTTRDYLNILIVVGDFGGGVNFFEKIFVEIFVFHI